MTQVNPRGDFFGAEPEATAETGRPASSAWEAVGWVVFLWALLATPAALWALYAWAFFR